MTKITLKESELRSMVEKTVRKVLKETELSYGSDVDPVDDNVSPFGLQDWLEEQYPDEMVQGIRGYEKIMDDLGKNNNLTIEIIDFFIKNVTGYVEGWMHNLKSFKERCERYKQYYKVTE